MTIEIDYGREEISAFTQSARAGEFSFDPTAAMAVVSLYDTMIRDLIAVRTHFDQASRVSGFGGFPSAQELQKGFADKATGGLEVVGQLIDAAMQMQEGLLCAANKFPEADALSGQRIAMLQRETDGQA
ncbi:hypothetical protein ACFWUP_06725 [Nocardia sp. NPDC058658]|uniref:hypothetical protein n=1 Tax=Nocardia sp. NPDC058658 TaxID=3346580 RepID=UPI003649D9C4